MITLERKHAAGACIAQAERMLGPLSREERTDLLLDSFAELDTYMAAYDLELELAGKLLMHELCHQAVTKEIK